MQRIARTLLLLLLTLASSASLACSAPFVDSVAYDPQVVIESATAIFAGRATWTRDDQDDAAISRLEVDTVYKGEAPRVLVIRARRSDHPCNDIKPPATEPFFAFLRAYSGNIQAPDWIGFVPQSAVKTDFVLKLGTPRPPSADSSSLLTRLAPASVPVASIKRSAGEVASESWIVNFDQKLWYWERQPRFYLRYPKATFLLEPDYVLEKLAQSPHPQLLALVRKSLPLTESVDLYKFQLNGDIPSTLTDLERLAVEATIDGRAQIFSRDGCCMRTVRVNRSSLGTQTVSFYETELVRSDWKP